ncbi:MAG TPA: thiamine-phosphate kinase [Polyangiaceae bacterium]|nr:thiamine-phosphate kinase [Polyangiaceae bacterium]
MSELSRLDRLRRFFTRMPLPAGVTVGIGDDAAVLAPDSASLVWTVDAAVEGVHFRRDWMSLEDIGFRSLMAAASDLAAMGARPRGVLSALVLPADFGDEALDRLMRGQAEAAAELGTAVVGGNLARGIELSITTTLLGSAVKPLLRAGAMPNDVVVVAGPLGLAAAGIEALRNGRGGGAVERAIAVYRRPRALIEESVAAAPRARAAIDLSDGLALDASRLAVESGVGIMLQAESVLAAGGPELLAAAAALSLDPLDLALYGGDDYAVLMTFGPGEVAPPFTAIGTCIAGNGIVLRRANGALSGVDPRGYDHFQHATAPSPQERGQ